MIHIDQRKQSNFGGILSPSRQCAYASSVMFITHFLPVPDLGKYYERYVDDTEIMVGKPGIAERLFPTFKGRSGSLWKVHQMAIQERMPSLNIVFEERAKIDDITRILSEGFSPVIVGTTNFGGLPGGHLLVAKENRSAGKLCNDPYGDAGTGYANRNGENVFYADVFLSKFLSGRVIYAKRK